MITVDSAIKFVRANSLLKDWTDHQLAVGIIAAIKDGTICYSVTTNGDLDGLVFGRWIIPNRHIFIRFAAGKGRLKSFFRYLRKTFPDCKKLTAIRFGKEVTYSV